MAEQTLKFLPILCKSFQVKITVKLFFIGGSGDSSGRMRTAKIMTNFELLNEKCFDIFMFGEVVSDANAIDATPDYDIVECVLGG
jgi:hypothetical protein